MSAVNTALYILLKGVMRVLAKISKEKYKQTNEPEYIIAGLLIASTISYRKFKDRITPNGVRKAINEILEEGGANIDESEFKDILEIFR
jgi:hypothetical protein